MFDLTLFGVDLLELNFVTVVLRMFLSTLCGCLLGIERTRKGRAAGMRTYALVCAGAALVMMTSQFINGAFDITTDPGRMGAQVISGIGFLCAGTILLTGHHKVTGLTTAAGLWAAACIGLAMGVGFYAGALLLFATILIVMIVFDGYRDHVGKRTEELHLFLILSDKEAAVRLLQTAREQGYVVSELVDAKNEIVAGVGLSCMLRAEDGKRMDRGLAVRRIRELPGVLYVEEIW